MPITSHSKPGPTQTNAESGIKPLELSTLRPSESNVEPGTKKSCKTFLKRFVSTIKTRLFGTSQSAKITPFSDMPDDFKAVVAGTKGPNDISDFKPIITDMKQYFETNNLGELYTKLTTEQGVSEKELACAWMMKLGNNESLTDDKFLNYISKGLVTYNSQRVIISNYIFIVCNQHQYT